MRTFTNPKVLWLLAPPTIGVIYSLYSILAGKLYLEELHWVDVTTVLFLSLLTYRGIYVVRKAPLLKIVALCLLNAFSFIYCFESIYKLLFLGWLYSSAELRELLLQGVAALTPLLAFYYGDFKLGRRSLLFALLFAAMMAFWVAIGYPQLFMGRVHSAWIDLEVSQTCVYVINRSAKFFLFLAYFFFYSMRETDHATSWTNNETASD